MKNLWDIFKLFNVSPKGNRKVKLCEKIPDCCIPALLSCAVLLSRGLLKNTFCMSSNKSFSAVLLFFHFIVAKPLCGPLNKETHILSV